jgi:regulatory protein
MKKNVLSMPSDQNSEFKTALQRAASYCSKREVSSGQLLEKLRIWKVPESLWGAIMERLKEEKFVDDGRYASLFVKEKFNLNQWGRVKIAHMLRRQGVAVDLIQQALEMIDEEAYTQACRDLILHKSATLKDKNQFTRKSKLLRFAAGKGYETELIYRILNSPSGE